MGLCFVLILSFLSVFAQARHASRSLGGLQKRVGLEQAIARRDVDPTTLYPAYNLSVPIDHFHNESRYEPHTNDTFNLRYWFDASHYTSGGPVIVLQSGEDPGDDRLVYLQKGILAQLAQATHGIGVVLEHRYYGTSFPVPDLSTENLRFLTTQQALADEAYFAQNVVFEGFEDVDLTAPNVAYIGYGGSYAGGFNASLRVLYPDIFWGTIASSGVVEAIYDYWEYYEPVRVYGPPDCISNTQKLINVVDNILIGLNYSNTTTELKTLFGLQNVTYDDDFADVLGSGIGGWQGLNWDPAVNDPSFTYYCDNLTSPTVLYPSTTSLSSLADSILTLGGYGSESATLLTPLLNYVGYINLTSVTPCAASGSTQDECFSEHNATYYAQDDLSQQTWRSWSYQVCTEWGYLQTGSGVPASQLPLISRTQTLEYESLVCRLAFNISTPPDTGLINAYGGFNISADRLAFLDGEHDPWRPATVHAYPFNTTAPTSFADTAERPAWLIPGAVHHWDENGLFANETVPGLLPPPPVADAQAFEVQWVLEWMEEWAEHVLARRDRA